MVGFLVVLVASGLVAAAPSAAHAQASPRATITIADGQPPAPSPPSDGQQPPTFREEVKVTAEKWDEAPERVPLSLTLIEPATTDISGALLLNQLGPYVPGLFLKVDGDRSFNKPSLRGITSSPFNDAAVGIYVDDVPMDPRMGLATPLVDAERIEVVRGPQGVIWGRNTSGGVLHLVTRAPGNTWQTRAGMSFGNFGEVVTPLAIQGPLSSNTLFLGVSGLFEHRAGFLDNPVKPDNRDSRQGGFGRIVLRWLPSSRWDVQLRNETGVWRDGTFLASRLDAANPLEIRSGTDSFEDSEVFQQSVRVRREGRSITMTAIASRRQVAVDTLRDEDYTADLDEVTSTTLRDTRWTGEVRLQSPNPARTRWLVGAFASSRDATDRYETYLPVTFAGYSDKNGAAYEEGTIAAFAQVSRPIGARVRLTGGLRLDHDRKRMDRDDRMYGLPTQTPTDDVIAPAFSLDHAWTFVSPRVSIDVLVTPSTTIYGGIARGARSGGFNYVTDTPQLARFNGEYVLSTEGGVKGRWLAGRVAGSIAAYHSRITDLQFQQFVSGFFAVANAGRATSRGLELEGQFGPGGGISIRGAYAFTDATLESFNNGFADFSGNRVPSVPRSTALAAIAWRGTRGIEADAELQGQGRIFFDEANQTKQNGYAVLNLRAGLNRGAWSLHLYVRNATDTSYLTVIAPGFYQVPGPPRRFGVSFSIQR